MVFLNAEHARQLANAKVNYLTIKYIMREIFIEAALGRNETTVYLDESDAKALQALGYEVVDHEEKNGMKTIKWS